MSPKLVSSGSTDSNDSCCTNALADIQANASVLVPLSPQRNAVAAPASAKPTQAAAAVLAASEVSAGGTNNAVDTNSSMEGSRLTGPPASHQGMDSAKLQGPHATAEVSSEGHIRAADAAACSATAAADERGCNRTSAAAVPSVTPGQEQPAGTAVASPAVSEEDITRWIQLPQRAKGRSGHGPPSAEQPWQVWLCCAALLCQHTLHCIPANVCVSLACMLVFNSAVVFRSGVISQSGGLKESIQWRFAGFDSFGAGQAGTYCCQQGIPSWPTAGPSSHEHRSGAASSGCRPCGALCSQTAGNYCSSGSGQIPGEQQTAQTYLPHCKCPCSVCSDKMLFLIRAGNACLLAAAQYQEHVVPSLAHSLTHSLTCHARTEVVLCFRHCEFIT